MIVGLTGGIGSGKTTVAQVLKTMGFIVYNSDEKAKLLYFQPSIKQQVINLLGKEAYLNENEIDKNYISQKIFSNTELLHKLNAIIHPAVKEDFIQFQKKHSPETLIIKETALLFEIGANKNLDYSILVTAPTKIKIERVIKRNSISKTEVEKRVEAQWEDEKKIQLADFVIVNDNESALIPQVLQVVQKIKQHA